MLHIVIVSLSFILTSCKMSDRRDIYDHVRQTVRITLDWVNANYYYKQDHGVERPLAATIMLYPDSPEVETMKLLTNMTSETMNLPLGSYSVVSHNEYGGGFLDNTIALSGVDAISTYTASWMIDPLKAEYVRSSASDGYAVVRSSDHLFVFASDSSVASEGGLVLDNTNFSNEYFEYRITPERVTMPVTMLVLFYNIDYTASSGSYVYVDGMSGGYNFSAHAPSTYDVTHINYLTGRRYIGEEDYKLLSNFKGYNDTGYDYDLVYGFGLVDVADFNVFGVPTPSEDGNDYVNVTVRIKMRGAFDEQESIDRGLSLEGSEYILEDQPTIYEREFENVKIEYRSDPSGIGPDYIHLEIGAFDGEDKIVLPWVPDDNNSGSAFNPDVDDWGDEVIVPVPMF